MEKKKILFVSQESMPFMPETNVSRLTRYLPQKIQEQKKEIRVFMPKYGSFNEKKHAIHEVLRLSGMNVIINKTDNILWLKVTSIPVARMQIYFIDNEDIFHKQKGVFANEKNKPFENNDFRMIFFTRSIIEIIKKLKWSPDMVYCLGWFTSLMPIYLKKEYNNDQLFKDTKVIFSVFNSEHQETFKDNFKTKIKIENIKPKDVDILAPANFINLNKMGIKYSDATVIGDENIDPEIMDFIIKQKKPSLAYQTQETEIDEILKFIDKML